MRVDETGNGASFVTEVFYIVAGQSHAQDFNGSLGSEVDMLSQVHIRYEN